MARKSERINNRLEQPNVLKNSPLSNKRRKLVCLGNSDSASGNLTTGKLPKKPYVKLEKLDIIKSPKHSSIAKSFSQNEPKNPIEIVSVCTNKAGTSKKCKKSNIDSKTKTTEFEPEDSSSTAVENSKKRIPNSEMKKSLSVSPRTTVTTKSIPLSCTSSDRTKRYENNMEVKYPKLKDKAAALTESCKKIEICDVLLMIRKQKNVEKESRKRKQVEDSVSVGSTPNVHEPDCTEKDLDFKLNKNCRLVESCEETSLSVKDAVDYELRSKKMRKTRKNISVKRTVKKDASIDSKNTNDTEDRIVKELSFNNRFVGDAKTFKGRRKLERFSNTEIRKNKLKKVCGVVEPKLGTDVTCSGPETDLNFDNVTVNPSDKKCSKLQNESGLKYKKRKVEEAINKPLENETTKSNVTVDETSVICKTNSKTNNVDFKLKNNVGAIFQKSSKKGSKPKVNQESKSQGMKLRKSKEKSFIDDTVENTLSEDVTKEVQYMPEKFADIEAKKIGLTKSCSAVEPITNELVNDQTHCDTKLNLKLDNVTVNPSEKMPSKLQSSCDTQLKKGEQKKTRKKLLANGPTKAIATVDEISKENDLDSKLKDDVIPNTEKSVKKQESNLKLNWETKLKGLKLKNLKKKNKEKNHHERNSSLHDITISGVSVDCSQRTQGKHMLPSTENHSRSSHAKKIILNDLSELIKSYSSLEYGESEDRVYKLLANSCCKRLRHITNAASKEQLRNGHSSLNIYDFQKGLLLCNEEPVSNAFMPKKRGRKSRIIPPQSAQNKRPQASFPCAEEFWIGHSSPLDKDPSEISDDLKMYYQVLTKVIENEGESCVLALEDLKTNKNILPLIPFLINFVSCEIMSSIHNFSKLSIALQVVEALLSNPFLHFGDNTHLSTLAYLMVKCLLCPLQSFESDGDIFQLKDKAADHLNHVLKSSRSRNLWFELLFVLEAAFSDKDKSFITHYGALAAINSMGVFAVIIAVIPHIDWYIKHLHATSTCHDNDVAHVLAVRGQLLYSSYLISHHIQHKNSERHDYVEDYILEKNKLVHLSCLETLADYFGDSMVTHVPSLNFVFTPNNRLRMRQNIMNDRLKKVPRFSDQAKNQSDKSNFSQENQINLVFDLVPLKKHTITFKQ